MNMIFFFKLIKIHFNPILKFTQTIDLYKITNNYVNIYEFKLNNVKERVNKF